jgi:hypothetical protein
VGILDSARLSQLRMTYDDRICGGEVFPSGRLDADLQQVDLRTQNSWRMRSPTCRPRSSSKSC